MGRKSRTKKLKVAANDRLTIEELMDSYSQDELKRVYRFCMVNEVDLLSEEEVSDILKLPLDSNRFDYYYHFPRGVRAPIDSKKLFYTTDFDCNCEGNCNITDLSKILFRALFKVRKEFRHKIHVVTGYQCVPKDDSLFQLQLSKGNALILQSSDNDRLYKLWDKLYTHYTIFKDKYYVYVSLTVQRDTNNNIDPYGPRTLS